MPIFLELTPLDESNPENPYVQKRMYRAENIHSFHEADVPGKEYTQLIFDADLDLRPLIVQESYMDIWETLNNLGMVKEVVEDE